MRAISHRDSGPLLSVLESLQQAGIASEDNIEIALHHRNPKVISKIISQFSCAKLLDLENYGIIMNVASDLLSISSVCDILHSANILNSENAKVILTPGFSSILLRPLQLAKSARVLTQEIFDIIRQYGYKNSVERVSLLLTLQKARIDIAECYKVILSMDAIKYAQVRSACILLSQATILNKQNFDMLLMLEPFYIPLKKKFYADIQCDLQIDFFEYCLRNKIILTQGSFNAIVGAYPFEEWSVRSCNNGWWSALSDALNRLYGAILLTQENFDLVVTAPENYQSIFNALEEKKITLNKKSFDVIKCYLDNIDLLSYRIKELILCANFNEHTFFNLANQKNLIDSSRRVVSVLTYIAAYAESFGPPYFQLLKEKQTEPLFISHLDALFKNNMLNEATFLAASYGSHYSSDEIYRLSMALKKENLLTPKNIIATNGCGNLIIERIEWLSDKKLLTQPILDVVIEKYNDEPFNLALNYLYKKDILTKINFSLICKHSAPNKCAIALSVINAYEKEKSKGFAGGLFNRVGYFTESEQILKFLREFSEKNSDDQCLKCIEKTPGDRLKNILGSHGLLTSDGRKLNLAYFISNEGNEMRVLFRV